MNAELRPFKTGEHHSKSASTLDRDITPLIIFLILLKIGLEVSTGVKVTAVKSFLNQTNHANPMVKNPNAPYMSIIG